jgi:putative tRNA adenosine deaminase-associated protein
MGGWTSKQVRLWPCPSGTKYARSARALRMSLLGNVPIREAAVCLQPVHGRSSHAGVPGGCIVRNVAMPEASETDFAIVVFREDDGWDADVLPVAVTDDLKGFIRVLRQQPSIAGTIGLAGIDDYFFVAIRVVGNQVSVLLSDIGAALDYPLAEQVLDYLEIPVPDEDDLDQVLPVGDLSIFADLGLDEMDLAAICSRLDFDSDDDPWDHVEDAIESIAVRLGFGPAMERALDIALGA